MYLVFVLYALFASVFIIAKTGLEYSQPLFLMGSRMVLAGIIMLGYEIYKNPKKFNFNKTILFRLFALATFNIYLTNALELWGLQYLTAFKTCFIYSLSPFLAALLSYFVFSEALSQKKWLGLFIGIIGITPALLSQSSAEEGTSLLFISWPEIALIVATLSSAYGWILLKQIVQENNYSPFMANSLSMLIGGTMALVHSSLVEEWNPIPVTEFVPYFECTIALLVISNLICYNLYGSLLKRFSATFMSFAGFTTPVFTAILGWIFLGESVSWISIFSGVIVFAGLTVFYQDELLPQTREQSVAQSQ